MKLSKMLTVTLTSSLILVSNSAFTAPHLNSSKSNVYRLDTTDQNAEKACQDGGGKVATDKSGQKICVKKAQDNATNATTVKGSKSNSSE